MVDKDRKGVKKASRSEGKMKQGSVELCVVIVFDA